MKILNLRAVPFSYDKKTKTFYMSERDVMFDISYKLVNTKKNTHRVVNFTHSTGCEFEPDTRYVYESDDGFTLEVSNDPYITKKRGEIYLNAKLQNC